jgi:hypothetical protein
MQSRRQPKLASASAFAACVCLLALISLAAQPKPRKPPAAKAAASPLDRAAADLKKEFAPRLKDPNAAVRTECNYFTEHAADADVAPEQVLAAIERPPQRGEDPRTAAYVRWQLLSAAPETFDDALAPRLLAAYRKAPPPAPRYGMAEHERSALDKMLARARPQDDIILNEHLDRAQARSDADNASILAYRDELYRRLPPVTGKFVAGFRDAHERMAAAALQKEHMTRLIADVQAWALAGGGKAAEYAELAELVGRLRFVKSPPYYGRASVRRGKLGWTNATDELYSAKKLADLQTVLLQAARGEKAAAADR